MPDVLLTVRDVQQRLAIGKPDGVLKLIHAGLLLASNVSAGARATWRIDPADLAAFIELRKSKPPAKAERRRKRDALAGVTRYSDSM